MHPILIYEDVDQPKRTVSLEQALNRLEKLGVPLDDKERINITRAALRRNEAVHYAVNVNRFEWRTRYAQLFEFVHFFHHRHFKDELHSHIARENWAAEARLMTFFKQNFVTYQGTECPKDYPKEILAAQRIVGFSDGRTEYHRIRYGDETGDMAPFAANSAIPCHDCGVVRGQYHVEGCDVEECPKCHGQFLGCVCPTTWDFELHDS